MNDIRIGATLETMVTLASLGVVEPLTNCALSSQDFDQADGLVSGQGWGLDTWRWGFITAAQYTALRAYCPGKSAQVYIRAIKPGKIPGDFRAVLVWPTRETRAGGKFLDFTLEFRLLEEYEIPE